jgi:hypothetical protein
MSKTIFATTFCNELEILTIQLEENADLFSDIVIIEAAQYHNGDPKPFILEQNWDRYSKWHEKLHYVRLHELPVPNPSDPFLLDRTHRNHITTALNSLNIVEDDSLCFLADVDEIVKHDRLEEYLKAPRDFVVFQGEYRVYKFNLRCVNKIWNGLTGFRGKIVLEYPAHTLIKMRDRYDNAAYWNEPSLIRHSLNHLGYMQTPEQIYNKFLKAAEPFSKSCIMPFDDFTKFYDEKCKPGGSFMFIDQTGRDDLKLELTDLSDSPQYIQDNQEKYKELIWKE